MLPLHLISPALVISTTLFMVTGPLMGDVWAPPNQNFADSPDRVIAERDKPGTDDDETND